jgi:hypothetical protein
MKIAPDVAAALTAQIPARLVKKLDADPALAKRWTWKDASVETDKGEVVTLQLVDGVARGVTCSCLLSPKCLHVAAVVAVLEPAGTLSISATGDSRPQVDEVDNVPAQEAFRVCADVLAAGADATGAFAQGELLRAIHACRTAGLHRLAAAQTRLLRSIRELRADRPEFALGALAADLREALAVAQALARGDSAPALVGRARRDYESIGGLRLRGVLTEAIVARSGYAGAVTYLIDERGTLYSRADVAPGDAGRAAGAYDAAAGLGDAVLPHRELCRAGLFVSDATASADGRLGAGQQVRAVRASEPSTWDHPLLAERWQRPLDTQLASVAAHDGSPDSVRPAGWDLVFVEGAIYGGAIVIAGRALELYTSLDQRILHARDNLAILARAPGLRVRAIGRVRLAAPRRLDVLALGPAPGETRMALPDAWHGRANLHYDKLSVPAPGDAPPPELARPTASAGDLLEPLRRRVERVALGGIATLPVHALPEVDREAAALAERALRGGAEALRDLAACASETDRAMTGARRAIDCPRFARAWLRAALYEAAARRRLAVASW